MSIECVDTILNDLCQCMKNNNKQFNIKDLETLFYKFIDMHRKGKLSDHNCAVFYFASYVLQDKFGGSQLEICINNIGDRLHDIEPKIRSLAYETATNAILDCHIP